MKILLPVVAPILLGTVEQLDLMRDPLAAVACAQKRDRLRRRDVRFHIHVYKRLGSVLAQQLLVDQVDVRNILHDLLHVAVILNIDPRRRHLVCDVTGAVDVSGIHRNFDFSPVFHKSSTIYKLCQTLDKANKIIHVFYLATTQTSASVTFEPIRATNV